MLNLKLLKKYNITIVLYIAVKTLFLSLNSEMRAKVR